MSLRCWPAASVALSRFLLELWVCPLLSNCRRQGAPTGSIAEILVPKHAPRLRCMICRNFTDQPWRAALKIPWRSRVGDCKTLPVMALSFKSVCTARLLLIGNTAHSPCLPRFAADPTPHSELIQIPIAVVVTKIDICPPTVLKQTRQALAKYLRQNQKMPYPIKDVSQARTALPLKSLAFCAFVTFSWHSKRRTRRNNRQPSSWASLVPS